MGWGSAGGIFDTVADALIEANASYVNPRHMPIDLTKGRN